MNAAVTTRDIFDAEHEAFRRTARTFFEKEVVPFHDGWEKAGIVPREVWTKAGEAGLLCFDVPEEYGGPGVADFRYNQILSEEQTRAGTAGPRSGPRSRSSAGCLAASPARPSPRSR
jgi:alkylation response protein AidB-like acyl-CoA dehydrogenase